MRFAKDGEDAPLAAVQGSDRRLKNATTTARGIVELAEDGEDADCVAVQGSDRRLKNATTLTKGIVELAEDGEDAAGVVVQGNDRRLKYATEDAPGIVVLAADGETRKVAVLQSNDRRLSDPREPLPHTHNYAPLVHAYSSHSGTITIRKVRRGVHRSVPPRTPRRDFREDESRRRRERSTGVGRRAGDSRVWGVLGHGVFAGVRGIGGNRRDGPGCGVSCLRSRGGFFATSTPLRIVVDGYARS
jgi:hypothetical protein